MVVRGEQTEMHLEHFDTPPVLACEILSLATWKVDTEVKREIYLENGVRFYLIFDTDLKVSKSSISIPTNPKPCERVNPFRFASRMM